MQRAAGAPNALALSQEGRGFGRPRPSRPTGSGPEVLRPADVVWPEMFGRRLTPPLPPEIVCPEIVRRRNYRW